MTEETKTPKAEATPPPEKKRRVSEETPVPTALELKSFNSLSVDVLSEALSFLHFVELERDQLVSKHWRAASAKAPLRVKSLTFGNAWEQALSRHRGENLEVYAAVIREKYSRDAIKRIIVERDCPSANAPGFLRALTTKASFSPFTEVTVIDVNFTMGVISEAKGRAIKSLLALPKLQRAAFRGDSSLAVYVADQDLRDIRSKDLVELKIDVPVALLLRAIAVPNLQRLQVIACLVTGTDLDKLLAVAENLEDVTFYMQVGSNLNATAAALSKTPRLRRIKLIRDFNQPASVNITPLLALRKLESLMLARLGAEIDERRGMKDCMAAWPDLTELSVSFDDADEEFLKVFDQWPRLDRLFTRGSHRSVVAFTPWLHGHPHGTVMSDRSWQYGQEKLPYADVLRLQTTGNSSSRAYRTCYCFSPGAEVVSLRFLAPILAHESKTLDALRLHIQLGESKSAWGIDISSLVEDVVDPPILRRLEVFGPGLPTVGTLEILLAKCRKLRVAHFFTGDVDDAHSHLLAQLETRDEVFHDIGDVLYPKVMPKTDRIMNMFGYSRKARVGDCIVVYTHLEKGLTMLAQQQQQAGAGAGAGSGLGPQPMTQQQQYEQRLQQGHQLYQQQQLQQYDQQLQQYDQQLQQQQATQQRQFQRQQFVQQQQQQQLQQQYQQQRQYEQQLQQGHQLYLHQGQHPGAGAGGGAGSAAGSGSR